MLRVAGNEVRITCRWQNYGEFLLSASPRISLQELNTLLFAYHADSFYGTFLQSRMINGVEGWLLPAHWAVSYFCEPRLIAYANIKAESFQTLQPLAAILQRALKNGWYMPDFYQWKIGGTGWRLSLPEGEQQVYDNYIEQTAAEELVALENWFDRAVKQIVVDEKQHKLSPGMESLLPRLEQSMEVIDAQKRLLRSVWHDEEEWLIELGWLQDDIPFRIALQLMEPKPESDEMWTLGLVFEGKAQSEDLIEATVEGIPKEKGFPAAWKPYIAEKLKRDKQKWLQIAPDLQATLSANQLLDRMSEEQAWLFLTKSSLRLTEAGVRVLLPSWWKKMQRRKPVLKAWVKSPFSQDEPSMFGLSQLMQFDMKIAIGDIELTEAEFQAILAEKKRFAYIRGNWVQLDPVHIRQIEKKLGQLNQQGGLSFREALEQYLVSAMDADEDVGQEDHGQIELEISFERQMEHTIQQLQRSAELPRAEVPEGLKGELRAYQHDGLTWMLFMRRLGLGCCLADDMGLGKTIQWISYVLYIKAHEGSSAPCLLICPTSVLANWRKELERFAPQLKVFLHYGPDRPKGAEFEAAVSEVDVVLTSYTLAHIDAEELSSLGWDGVALDEAQNIKNPGTKQAISVRKLTARHRVALTGTPLENRLSELWSIFHFMNPGYFGTLRQFNRLEPEQVQRMAKPFLLRRVKNDPRIELDLPEKNEMKCYVSLTLDQGLLYEQHLERLFNQIDQMSAMERRGAVLASITRLKQICNHPALVYNDEQRPVAQLLEQSNKLKRLLEMVREVRAQEERCLIFTQYIGMGRILQRVFSTLLQEDVPFMHGSIAKDQRDQMIEHFQSGDSAKNGGIFVLSLKTGGTGLNLTAANHVFHYDRWWNPAVENQATDRVYRIGQNRQVQVHKFITLGTMEEKIDKMLEQKQDLSQQIVGSGEQWMTEMSNEELREMLDLRKELMI